MNVIARFASTSAALLLAASACAGPSAESAGARPDPQFQSRIETVVAAIVRQDEAAAEQLDALRSFAAGRRGELLKQLALYLADSSSTERSMGGALVLGHLQFTPDEKIDAALADLPDAPGPLRKVLTDLLGTIDRPDGSPADFSVYESRLRAGRQSPSPETDALIRYMYETSPDAALRATQPVYDSAKSSPGATVKQEEKLRGILARHSDAAAVWSSDDLTAARTALTSLARDTGWWVRLYAAAVIAANPALATPELRSTLEKDTSPLVRAALSR